MAKSCYSSADRRSDARAFDADAERAADACPVDAAALKHADGAAELGAHDADALAGTDRRSDARGRTETVAS